MDETSRRNFLVVAGMGAASGTVAAATGIAVAAEAQTRRQPDAAQERVVAYINDHRSTELRLMVGEREILVRDRDLVNRILNAAGGK